MGAYLIRRTLFGAVTLLGITLVTFSMTRLAPGDPVLARASDDTTARLTATEHQRLRDFLGLDQPVMYQYGAWLVRLVRLDFGRSWTTGRSVSATIGGRLGATASLAAVSLGLAFVLSVVVGLYSAARAGGWFDRAAGVALYGLFATPNYVMAVVLIGLVSVKLGWLPVAGRRSASHADLSWWGRVFDLARHSILITICFAYPMWVYMTRFVRASALEIASAPFIRAVRAKGVGELRVWVRHVLPNTLIGLLTLLGVLLPVLVSGSVILEYIFGWPGIGSLYVDSILARDYPVVLGLTVVTAALVLAGTLAVDLAYGLVDPRVRYE